jgi:cytochrome b subunit of formate dehydrogenase
MAEPTTRPPVSRVSRGLAALGLLLVVAASAAESIPTSDCLQCHGDRDLTKTNAAGQTVSLFVDEKLFAASRHGTNTCASCHRDLGSGHPDDGVPARPVSCLACHPESSKSYTASVHGRALQNGQASAATCQDCHGTHNVLPHTSADSPLHPLAQLKTCGECHPEAAAGVRDSVHGKALAENRRDAPTCTDCHSEHRIEALKGASSLKISEQVCSRCHASERLNTKYRLPADRVKTFLESYHGLAAKLGSTRAANCASCHGVHQILPSSDPRSTIHKDHLVDTCGKCHPGANENFAMGRVHLNDNGRETGAAVNRWVRRFYLTLIVVLIGAFTLHNGLAWFRHALAARRCATRSVVRMSRSQRAQHMTLAVSFLVLAVSGFALKFPDSWLAVLLGSDEFVRRWIHRGSAIALVILGGYHVFYLALTGEGRQLVRDLWARKQDLTGLMASVRHLIGRGARPRPSARFGYVEKLEYWAVVWGTIIMGLTGLVIWFPVEATWLLPRWTIDVATTIHYYEAILACLAILVWHGYHVILDPEVYPLNWAFWDGRARKEDAGPESRDV